MFTILLIIVLSYLAGSIPGSVWVGKAMYGVDVREHGSRNAGATNVFRVLGWKAGVLCSIVDIGKGLLAAGIIASLRVGDGVPSGFAFWQVESVVRLIAGMAAIAGHMWPIWARFEGGKGVNTAAGMLFALTPISMWIVIGTFVVVLVLSRYVSLASMSAAVMFPAIIAIRRYIFGIEGLDRSLILFGSILAIGIFLAHRSNIVRLFKGTENRVANFRLARGLRGKGEL